MNALVWLLIPVIVTALAAWIIAHRTRTTERDESEKLSPAELERMRQALSSKTSTTKLQPNKSPQDRQQVDDAS